MLRPLRDRLVIEVMERVKSDIITVVSDEKPNLGRVVAVGPGKTVNGRVVPLDVRPGDVVRFGSGEGYLTFPEYAEGGKTYRVLAEADVCFISSEAHAGP